jgi:hypothetical protein
VIIIAIYKLSFDHGNALEAEHHIKIFEKLCAQIVTSNIDPGTLRIKLFPHSLVGEATTWYETLPQQDKHWFNTRAAFLEAYGDCSNNHQKLMLSFKQMEK